MTDLFNPNVVRASTGVLFSVPCLVEESTRVLAWLREQAIRSVATTPAAETLYSAADLRGPLASSSQSEVAVSLCRLGILRREPESVVVHLDTERS